MRDFSQKQCYPLSRAVVTRSDSGKPMFNYGEIGGSKMEKSLPTRPQAECAGNRRTQGARLVIAPYHKIPVAKRSSRDSSR